MNKKSVITRLCSLITEVGEQEFEHQLPHDCICDDNENEWGVVVDDKIIEYIEQAVRHKLSWRGK